MWSTSAGGHLMKVVNLTGFTVYENRTLACVAFTLFILSIIIYYKSGSTNKCLVVKSMLDSGIVHLLMLLEF